MDLFQLLLPFCFLISSEIIVIYTAPDSFRRAWLTPTRKGGRYWIFLIHLLQIQFEIYNHYLKPRWHLCMRLVGVVDGFGWPQEEKVARGWTAMPGHPSLRRWEDTYHPHTAPCLQLGQKRGKKGADWYFDVDIVHQNLYLSRRHLPESASLNPSLDIRQNQSDIPSIRWMGCEGCPSNHLTICVTWFQSL